LGCPTSKTWVKPLEFHCYLAEKPRYALYFRLMAAIFDFSQIRTTVILMSTLVVLPDPQNLGKAVGISFLSYIEVEICVISYLLPGNVSHLSFFFVQTWDIIRSSLIGLPDLKNIGIVVEIPLLSCIGAEVCFISYLLPVNGSQR